MNIKQRRAAQQAHINARKSMRKNSQAALVAAESRAAELGRHLRLIE